MATCPEPLRPHGKPCATRVALCPLPSALWMVGRLLSLPGMAIAGRELVCEHVDVLVAAGTALILLGNGVNLRYSRTAPV